LSTNKNLYKFGFSINNMKKKSLWGISFSIFAILILASVFFAFFLSNNYKGITGNVIVEEDWLTSWWTFEGNASDYVSGRDGVVHGASFVEGKVGKAVRFDGIDDYISIDYSNVINHDSSFTWGMWIKTESNHTEQQGRIIERRYNTGSSGDLIILRAGRSTSRPALYVKEQGEENVSNVVITNSSVSLSNMGWTHLTLVKNGSTGNFLTYINGQLHKTTDDKMSGRIRLHSLYLGSSSNPETGAYFFNGLLDELKIWNKALVPGDIEKEYNSFTCLDEDGDGVGVNSSYNCANLDCNDSNPDVWRLETIYIDNDGDGSGKNNSNGTLSCIGTEAPENYSTTKKDCNDNNSLIRPYRSENCSTSWDDDCDGNVNEGCSSTGGCNESWGCSNWGTCIGGTKVRTCVDLNGCNTTYNKPPLTGTCTTSSTVPTTTTSTSGNSTPSSTSSQSEINWGRVLSFVLIAALAVFVAMGIWVFFWMRKRKKIRKEHEKIFRPQAQGANNPKTRPKVN
jgi:hypothetical protein